MFPLQHPPSVVPLPEEGEKRVAYWLRQRHRLQRLVHHLQVDRRAARLLARLFQAARRRRSAAERGVAELVDHARGLAPVAATNKPLRAQLQRKAV